jgi:hypothetical protein
MKYHVAVGTMAQVNGFCFGESVEVYWPRSDTWVSASVKHDTRGDGSVRVKYFEMKYIEIIEAAEVATRIRCPKAKGDSSKCMPPPPSIVVLMDSDSSDTMSWGSDSSDTDV